MKTINIPLISALLLLISCIIYPLDSFADTESVDQKDTENVENSLIINGIKLDNNIPILEEDFTFPRGTIIYDDTFDDSITEYDNIKPKVKKKRSKKAKKKYIAKAARKKPGLIQQLRKKDKRWHLTSHKIRDGENLWDISKRYGIDHKFIIKANNIKNPDKLYKGNTILVPNKIGINYIVKRGDFLNKIARMHGIDTKKIVSHNNIKGDKIRIGEVFFLPDAVSKKKNKKRCVAKNKTRKSTVKYKKSLFKWPLRGKISSAFGNRISPISKRKKFHCGIDISVPCGTPVKAARTGKVIFSGWKQGYGRVVIMRHDKGYISVYAHNKRNIVRKGDRVRSGKVIAYSGKSGAVTGPHLHFELRKYLTPLNPLRFL